MSSQNDDSALNGDARIILFRIAELDKGFKEMRVKVEQLHDKMLSQPPLCPMPGMCLRLETQLQRVVEQEQMERKDIWEAIAAIKRLVWIGVGIIATISFAMPLIVAVLKHTLAS